MHSGDNSVTRAGFVPMVIGQPLHGYRGVLVRAPAFNTWVCMAIKPHYSFTVTVCHRTSTTQRTKMQFVPFGHKARKRERIDHKPRLAFACNVNETAAELELQEHGGQRLGGALDAPRDRAHALLAAAAPHGVGLQAGGARSRCESYESMSR